MRKIGIASMGLLVVGAFSGCGSNSGSAVVGKASFVQGGSTATRAPSTYRSGHRLTPGDNYIISPNKAKITFNTVVFKDSNGSTLGSENLTDCIVTYDRTKTSGSSLLDCPVNVPVGTIAEMQLTFSSTVQLYVDDGTNGIYSDATATGGFSTTRPTAGPDFVDFLVTAGASSTERQAGVIFSSPVTIAEGSSPQIYLTMDMIHSTQILVTGTGSTLGPLIVGSNDPVAVFGGLTKGTSLFYSELTSIDSYVVHGVKTLRIFYDADNKPLYLIGSTFCAPDTGPKGAWASPPIGATVGGWLGKDTSNVLAWALPTDSSYTAYFGYFTMQEQLTVGGSTSVNCSTATPPVPTDGKTYASGAPPMTGPTLTTLNLLAK